MAPRWMTTLIFSLLMLPLPLWAESPISAPPSQAAAKRLSVPPGFRVSVYAQELGNARGMALSPEGDLYVCDMKGGRILKLADQGGWAEPQVVVEGLRNPHSMAFHGGFLYVGETNRVSRFTLSGLRLSEEDGTTITPLPDDGGHFTRTILFGPDGKLYISIGSSCNACVEKDPRRATICRCNPDGTDFEVYANGLRNAVGMDFRPGTDELFASCNGRDLISDNLPPECLFKIGKGKNYGWPYSYSLHGKAVPDPDLGSKGVRQTGFSLFEYQAHAAPLGIRFYTGRAFPSKYRKGIFICFHGSWNRSIPVGYKVVFVPLDAHDKPGKARDFLWGFLQGAERVGRPVDVLGGPKGELFVSDDHGGRIFRVVYTGKGR